MERERKTHSGRSENLNLDCSKITRLSEQHQCDPNGFVNSLDSFFRNMCREMVETSQLQKGGKS